MTRELITSQGMLAGIGKIREEFPILHQKVHGKPLVYLDNAATSQKPEAVLDIIRQYYESYNSNIHRGLHFLSEKATREYENARSYIAQHINAAHPREVNFVRGTTEAINLLAQSYGRKFLKQGDEILISGMEHHSNIVPWQMLCGQTAAVLKVIPVNENGELDMEQFHQLLSGKTKIVSIVHVSNALGTINPVKEIIDAAHEAGAVVMVDGAQAAPHLQIDVQQLDCDFYAFSGHKVYAPTGIGIFYGKEKWLNLMDPYMGGGEMIKSVTFEHTEYNELPYKFEAGTPHICGGIALAAALKYISGIGIDRIAAHEEHLLQYTMNLLQEIEGIKFIGTAKYKAAVISFLVEGIHPYDIGVLLDKQGIAIRTGHHCTQPLMERFGIPGTCRASFALYNTEEEAEKFAEGLKKAVKMLV